MTRHKEMNECEERGRVMNKRAEEVSLSFIYSYFITRKDF